MKESTTLKRTHSLDLIRSFAIFSVVACHAVGFAYPLLNMDSSDYSVQSYLFAVVTFVFGRLGVPLFLFLSGFLLLDRNYDSADDILEFWKRKLLPMIITFEVWIVVFTILDVFVFGQEFLPKNTLKYMLGLELSGHGQLWYMPMIIGIYLFLPFVARALKALPLKVLRYPLMVTFVLILGFTVYDKMFPKSYGMHIDTAFSGENYGFYLVLGYVFKVYLPKIAQSKKKCNWALVLSAIGGMLFFAGAVLYQIYFYENHIQYTIWYDFPLLAVCCVCVFVFLYLFFYEKKLPFAKFFTTVSTMSMGIYFIHEPIQLFIVTKFPSIGESMNKPMYVCLVWITAFLLSLIISMIVWRIPVVSKILLLQKAKKKNK